MLMFVFYEVRFSIFVCSFELEELIYFFLAFVAIEASVEDRVLDLTLLEAIFSDRFCFFIYILGVGLRVEKVSHATHGHVFKLSRKLERRQHLYIYTISWRP